jgi:hypothetical protein
MADDKVQSSVQEKVKACRNKWDRSQYRARLPSNWHGDLNQWRYIGIEIERLGSLKNMNHNKSICPCIKYINQF